MLTGISLWTLHKNIRAVYSSFFFMHGVYYCSNCHNWTILIVSFNVYLYLIHLDDSCYVINNNNMYKINNKFIYIWTKKILYYGLSQPSIISCIIHVFPPRSTTFHKVTCTPRSTKIHHASIYYIPSHQVYNKLRIISLVTYN